MEKVYKDAFFFILDNGSTDDLARLYHRLPQKTGLLNDEETLRTNVAFQKHLNHLRNVSRNGIFPFNLESGNPDSIMSTALALSRLIEFDLLDDPLAIQIIEQLIIQQNDKGWWKDSDSILKVKELPFYQDPSNASVRIFNTAFVTSVLTHIKSEETERTLKRADSAFSKITSSNGVIPGFPQSSWFATKLFARIHGIDSSRFLLHWSVLSDLADKINDPGSLASIAENLIEAGVPTHDPLIQKCRRKIRTQIDTQSIGGKIYQGWSDTSNFLDTSITLRCLIILSDEEDHYLRKYKIQ